MLTKDKLWKAAFEDFFQEAILFYFPVFYPQIDWSRGFELLDKELRELFPESETSERRADLLVKVWLLNGTEQWLLIHIEAQGYMDTDFAERMYISHYRITDRFKMPVSSFALLTDPNKNWRPDRYVFQCMETELVFRYPIYKLADHTASEYDDDRNPWALVMKAAFIGLKGKWTDEALLNMKVNLYREMREKGYTPEQVRGLNQFIKFYVLFGKKDFFLKFDHEIKIVDNIKPQPMGLVELVREHLIEEAKQEGLEKGMEKGLEKGLEKGELKKAIAGIRNMVKKHFSDKDIVEILEVPNTLVLDIKKQLKKEPKIVLALKAPEPNLPEIAKTLKVSPLLVQIIKDSLK